MRIPDRFPRLVPGIVDGSGGRMPVCLDFSSRYLSDNAMCYFVRSYDGEWLSYRELPPQMIGIPPDAVVLLGGLINADDSDDAATLLGAQREMRAHFSGNVGPYDPENYLPTPEDEISDQARALDIYLVPPGVYPESLSGTERATYEAKRWLLRQVCTIGNPVTTRDEKNYARQVLSEAKELARVNALIDKRRKRYAKEGERNEIMYAQDNAR